uniref:Uncharacterized protein n=1 Tax=Anguilla anguilla TaxID=7936 RepID=A0A0E9R1K0_ANGAN
MVSQTSSEDQVILLTSKRKRILSKEKCEVF